MKDIGHHSFKFLHIQAKCALAVSRIAHTAHNAQRQARLRAIDALSDSSFGLAVLPCQLDDSETFRNVKGFAHGRVPGDRMAIVSWPLAPKQIDAHRVIKKQPA